MCAIAGIVGKRSIKEDTVEFMTDVQVHRGPDDSGLWSSADATTVFGHRRLSIIDVTSAGHQPMERNGLVITYNGEIYNYLELRKCLQAEGVAFRTESDTEVLLAAYAQWGEQCVTELNGMFAFAIFDPNNKRVFCARDHFGEKPFLYHVAPDFFAFASEYKALLSLQGVGAEFDPSRVLQFLHHPSRGLDDDEQTVFDQIKQLPPAHCLTLDLNTLTYSTRRYWDVRPDMSVANLTQEDAEARFRDLLIDSVRLRMRSDVPLGSCLSGGLDSSSIVCIARELLGDDRPYKTFTGRFPGSEADEWTWAEQIIEKSNATSHSTEPTCDGLLTDMASFMWHNELPVGSSSQYAQWCIFRLAGENDVTVLLDGQGGDELLGGYEQYFEHYLASLKGNNSSSEIDREHAQIQARYPLALKTAAQLGKQMIPHRLRNVIAHATGLGNDFSLGLKWPAASKVLDLLGNANEVPADFHPLTAALYEESLYTHLPVLLRYGDRNSMAHSREVRLPFCDHRIAEFSLSMSARVLMGGAQTKRLLRGAMKDILPGSTRERWGKQGFLPPQADWYGQGLGEITSDIINSPAFATSEIWYAPWWRKVIERFNRGEKHLASMLWRPFIDHMWRQHFIDRIQNTPVRPVFDEART